MYKLDCNPGNYQCGGKCQPNTNKCPRDIEKVDGEVIAQYTTLIKRKPKKVVEYPEEFKSLLNNLDNDVIMDAKIGILEYIKELKDEDPGFAKDIKKKNPKVKNGTIYYAIDGYHNINPMLRAEGKDNPNDEDLAILKIVLDDLEELDNYDGNKGKLYRGERPYNKGEPKNIGDTYTNKGLLSTTTDIKIAKGFAGNGGTIYEIIPKSKSNAKDLNFGYEKEVLYKHNQKFKIKDIITEKDYKKYILEEI